MKITIWVESGEASDKEFHRFTGQYEDVLSAEAGLRELVELYNKMAGFLPSEPDRSEPDSDAHDRVGHPNLAL